MDMARGDRKQVSLRLSAEQKAEWDRYADESNVVNSKAELIRRAVSQFIATDGDMGGATVATDDSSEEFGPEILEAVNGLEREIQDLGDRLGVVEDEVRTAPERSTLTNQIFEALPEDGSVPVTFEDIVVSATGDMSAAEEVREVLERLAENTGTVKKLDEEGEPVRYYKNV